MTKKITQEYLDSCRKMTELIKSCWNSNQELDSEGKPIDGLTFDERLKKNIQSLTGMDKKVMNDVLGGQLS